MCIRDSDGTVHDAVVGYGHGALSQFLDPFGQTVDPAGPVQEAVFRMDMEVNKGHRRFLSNSDTGFAAVSYTHLPEEGSTEGIDGLDIRLVNQEELPLEMAVTGMFRQALAQLLGDAAPELRRRRPGVGDNEEVVHIGFLLS